ncbi:MAG: 2-hydroxyacid dehydrogenase [Bacteroidales bacterium]|nr:2-hydroxyacid dehydrogenase [Bacteroidales bacterium]
MVPRIVFYDTKPYDKEVFTKANEAFGYEIKYLKYHLSEETVNLAEGYNVVCAFVNDEITAPVIERLHAFGIGLIALRSAGYNNVDFQAAFGKVHVVRVPAYSPHAVAEHTVALMLTLNRKIHRAYYRTREANFSLQGLMGFDFYGKTAGVIGTGKIGKVLIDILLGFGMKVLAYDVYPDKAFAESRKIEYVDLDTLYRESHVISLNCPLTKETEYMINKDSISKMRDGVMIINTGRGKLIRTADLIEGLKSGKVGSAGLDVYEEEGDYFFEDKSETVLTDDILARLLAFNNVIITSHQAFFTREALHNIADTTLLNIKEYAEGGYLSNEICYQCVLKGKSGCLKDEKKRCF